MNQAHWHLAINHLPIIIPIVGLLTLIGGYFLKNITINRTAYAIFIFGAITTVPAFFTGEGAEEIVENFQGITKAIIHEHEEKAELFAILSYILGGLSAFALWSSIKEKVFAKSVGLAVLLLSLGTLFIGKQVGTTGGEIRHTEIRADFNGANSGEPASNPTNSKHEDD